MKRPTPPPGRYVVTGAAGLVGSHALLALRDVPGVSVRAVHRHRPLRVSAANIEPVFADLTDPAQCGAVMEGADHALLFAGVLATAPVLARDPLSPVLANLRIAVNSLEAAYAQNIRKCLWLGSTVGYPPADGELDEARLFESDPPDSWYGMGWMVRYVETLCRTFSERLPRSMPVIVLRPSMIYGEYDDFDEATAHFLPSLIRRVVARENPIEVWGTGDQTRDLVHAADVVDAALAALATVDRFDAFNVAAGRSWSVNECLAMILNIDGFADARIVHLAGKPATLSSRRFDNGKAAAVLGSAPLIPLEDGLRRTIAWHRDSMSVAGPKSWS
jgi:GDP-L-fucose synthase